MIGDKGEQVSEKKKLNLSDSQIIKLDRRERLSKLNERYQPRPPDDLVRVMNELCDNICKILVEFRRLNDVLSYLSPPNEVKKEKGGDKNEQ